MSGFAGLWIGLGLAFGGYCIGTGIAQAAMYVTLHWREYNGGTREQ